MKKNLSGIIVTAAVLGTAFSICAGAESEDVTVIKAATAGRPALYIVIQEDNSVAGSDIEILQAVFDRLPQYELEIVVADDPLTGLLSDQFDLAVNNYGWREERGETYYYSFPYKTGYDVYIQRADDEPLTSLKDLSERGCRITYPEPGIGKIGRVCVIREKQRNGVGRKLIEEAEKWILEQDVHHIVINSQDRAAAFYHKLGYVANPDVDPDIYEHSGEEKKERQANRPDLGFRCVLVEKYPD